MAHFSCGREPGRAPRPVPAGPAALSSSARADLDVLLALLWTPGMAALFIWPV